MALISWLWRAGTMESTLVEKKGSHTEDGTLEGAMANAGPTLGLEAEEWEIHLAQGLGVEFQFCFGHAGWLEALVFPSVKWRSASKGHNEGCR